MNKNFLWWKSGHEASDEYFKNAPLWHDIDIAKAFIFGVFVGSFFTATIYLFLITSIQQ